MLDVVSVQEVRVGTAREAAADMDTRPTDRMYDCLPMYHTAGGLVATGSTTTT